MQAIVQDSYGSTEVLESQDIDKPEIAANEVLVRVHAASIHVGDWILMTGSPFVMRFATGLRKPKNRVPGTDVAGTVEAVGADVTRFQPGDEVFGWCAGAFAEYARAAEDQLLEKPADLTFEQAAAIGVSASTALQLLRDDGKVQPGQKVLINGASGGVGTFAVQIAKALGAEVTGVCSTKNVDLVRSIGADHVIDYTQVDFTAGTERYDLILDNVGNQSMARTRRALAPTRDPDLERRRACGREARPDRAGDARLDGRAPAGEPDGQDAEPRRPGRRDRVRRSRHGQARHRPDLPAPPDPRSHRSRCRRPRTRNGRHHDGRPATGRRRLTHPIHDLRISPV